MFRSKFEVIKKTNFLFTPLKQNIFSRINALIFILTMEKHFKNTDNSLTFDYFDIQNKKGQRFLSIQQTTMMTDSSIESKTITK